MIKSARPIKLTEEQLRKVQFTLLQLLCEVRRICDMEGIHYTIIAGTMLGAIRHGGFIPWDDDADIAMFRADYEAFCIACEKHLDRNKFYFQDITHTEGYRWGYGKLRRKGSRYVVCGTENMPYEQGIWIDIFPLDYVPDSRVGRAVSNLHCFFIRKFLYAEVGKIREQNVVKRTFYRIMAKIPIKKVTSHYTKYIQRRNKSKTNWMRILMFPTPNREYGYLYRWYANTAPVSFEGEIFSGIQDYDEYLSFKFGNYLELPPKDKRKQHFVSELKFAKPEEDSL